MRSHQPATDGCITPAALAIAALVLAALVSDYLSESRQLVQQERALIHISDALDRYERREPVEPCPKGQKREMIIDAGTVTFTHCNGKPHIKMDSRTGTMIFPSDTDE